MSEMHAVSHASPATEKATVLTPREALKRAWTAYIIMMFVPFLVFLAVLTVVGASSTAAAGETWFMLSMIVLAVGVPASFFIRSRIFRAYYEGQVVSPRDYLRGMMVVWVTLEIAGIFALLGCAVTGSLMPNMLPALVAFILFTPFWPSGDSMINAVGADDDAAVFKHPR